jgi:CheY-like chemotaxis protein
VEAVVIFTQHQEEIALVLTDMMMPAMDGSATICALRKIKPDLAIIAASGLKADMQVEKANDAGVKHFLSKPYTTRALLDVLDEVLHAGN